MRQTNPWTMFHSVCLFAIVVTVYDVSGIGEPRNKAPLPQISQSQSGIDQVGSLLKNLEHLK